MRNTLGVLSSTRANFEFREDLQIIEEETRRTSGILNSLMECARSHSMTLEDVDLTAVCKSGSAFLGYQLRTAGGELKMEELPDSITVNADANHLKQVLINILMNSIQAMPEGGSIGMKIVRDDSQPGFVTLRIADSGKGIPAEDLPYIFKPFFSKKGEQGTGLGMFMAKRLIQGMGGSIDIESESGRGGDQMERRNWKARCRVTSSV